MLNTLKLVQIVGILIFSLSITYYFVIFLPEFKVSSGIVENTLKCNELFKIKKPQYKKMYWRWEVGEGEVVFSSKLADCLAINLQNNSRGVEGLYTGSVIKMSDDTEILNYYEQLNINKRAWTIDKNDQKKQCISQYNSLEYLNNKKYGCDKPELYDEMIEIIRDLGFNRYGSKE